MKRLLITAVLTMILLVLGACQQVDGGIILRTADENLSFFVPIPAAEVGEALPVTQPDPPCDLIKGNINRAGEKIAHTEDSPQWDQIKISEPDGERWFCSMEDAIAAGWRKARN